MDAFVSPLVLTKLRAPAMRPRNISRLHLFDRVPMEARTGLVFVCAPAGYGKTTLLAEWAHCLQQDGTPVAWYSLDTGDNSPAFFGAYLVASFSQAFGPTSDLANLAQFLRASPEIDLGQVLPGLINAIASSEQPCWLILDDYHLINNPAIHQAIAYLIDHRPENLHLILGGRSDPPLPLARLRAQGKLFEIRASRLRFTVEETARFLNQVMLLDLSPELISVLEERTEGWVAGLQLAAIVLQLELSTPSSPVSTGKSDQDGLLSSFTGGHRYLVKYLLEEVFSRQSTEMQSFLLATSILERMGADLCDAIRGEPGGSGAILEQLEQSNLFVVALDAQGDWYRYHHLFRDFLQTRLLKSQAERLPALHRAASEWYAAHGALHEAARHALQTQDWDYAADFVEQHSFDLIIHSEIATIHEWCSAFPEAVLQARPMLCILQCWPWVFRFRTQNRIKIEARLQQAQQMIAALEDRQLASDLSEHAAVVRSFLAMAPDSSVDPWEQLAQAQNTLGSIPESDARRLSTLLTVGYTRMALHEAQAASQALEEARQVAREGQLYFGIVESTFHLARLAHCQGQLQRAAQLCLQGQAELAGLLTHPEQELRALGCLDIALGCVLFEQDQLEEAEWRLLHGLDLIGWGMNPYYPLAGYVALSRLREIQGRSAEALAFLDRLEAAWPDISFCTQGLRLVHALRAAPSDPAVLAEAVAWLRNFSPASGSNALLPGMGPFGAAEVYYLASNAWASLQITAGHPEMALPYLERQLAVAQANGLTTRAIELSLLQAQAAQAADDGGRAREALERALLLAQPEGFVRTFDQGPALARLLVEVARRGENEITVESARRILAAILPPPLEASQPGGPAASAAPPRVQTPDLWPEVHLSERELELLRCIAQGASNQAIAERLVITVGTVKSHINHILRKLDARNRTEAVARARELGLLDR